MSEKNSLTSSQIEDLRFAAKKMTGASRRAFQEPWLIVTDLKPKEGNALWYSLRSWIEASYRDIKSDG